MSFPIRAAAAAILVLAGACGNAGRDTSSSAGETGSASPVVTTTGDVATASHQAAVTAADSTTVTVYKSPTCGCCNNWVDHMREAGFKVVAINSDDMNTIKHQHGIGADLGSCHTAMVGGYVLEGHVPAADVKRLLTERPQIAGLAAPGMPMGSPGMEGPISQKYDVIAFDKAGARSVFASH